MSKFHYIIISIIAGIVSLICIALVLQDSSLKMVYGVGAFLGLIILGFSLYKASTFEQTHVKEMPQGSNVYAKVCPHCGTMLKGHERFCPSCNEDVQAK